MSFKINLASYLVLELAFASAAVANPTAQVKPLDCKIGPASKEFGETTWLVYACNDAHSVILVSAPGSKAFPFLFSFIWSTGRYQLSGEGTGDKSATDAAFREIGALSPSAIQTLLRDAQVAKPK